MLRWLCGWVRFDQLDRDGSGYLQGDELLALVGWVWDSYHPKGQPLGKQHRVELRKKLMHMLDEDHNGNLAFEEFRVWFTDTCKAIEQFRRTRAHELRQQETEERAQTESKLLIRARKKFAALDVDGSGDLQGRELLALVASVL